MAPVVLSADSDEGPVAVLVAQSVLGFAVAHVKQLCDMSVVFDEKADPRTDKCQRATFELDPSWDWLKLSAKRHCAHLDWLVYYCFCHHTSPDSLGFKKD